MAIDISQRKMAEEKLADSHNLMRYIIEHTNSAVAVHDRDCGIYVSQRYLDQYKVRNRMSSGKITMTSSPTYPRNGGMCINGRCWAKSSAPTVTPITGRMERSIEYAGSVDLGINPMAGLGASSFTRKSSPKACETKKRLNKRPRVENIPVCFSVGGRPKAGRLPRSLRMPPDSAIRHRSCFPGQSRSVRWCIRRTWIEYPEKCRNTL